MKCLRWGGPGPKGSKRRPTSAPCWGHVGTFFAIRRLFFVPGWFLPASCTFWPILVVFFGPAGLDFLFFGSTLKRGGTCAAHGIDAKNMLFFIIGFFGLWPRFGSLWASKLEPSWLSWTPKALPKAFKIQSFGNMCPRCFPRGSQVAPKGVPRKAQSSIFEGFSIDLGIFFRHFFL